MASVLIDTSALIELVKASEKGMLIKEYVQDKSVCIATPIQIEFLRGIGKSYEYAMIKLLQTKQFLPSTFEVGIEAIWFMRTMKKRGRMISAQDYTLCAYARVYNMEIVTCDQDFTYVPTVRIKLF